MIDEILSDDDLLLFDVVTLINAYEEAMFKSIRSEEPSEEIILTGYQNPLTGVQVALELSLFAADSSMEEIVDNVVQEQQKHDVSSGDEEASSADSNQPEEDIKHFYAECELTNEKGEATDEWWDPQDSTVRKNLNFNLKDKWDGKPGTLEPIGYEYKKKLTNEWNVKMGGKVTKWLEDNAPTVDIGNKTYKLSIEECLNCMIDINIGLTLPSLEFVFNLDKFLNQIDQMLKDMLRAMDPSLLYDAICQFLLNFGANFACPANLIGINLVLPTLFAKYSLDLAKIRFDWTGLFGGMIKTLLNFLVQAVESIPRVVNPFIDCIINAMKTIMNALRAIVASGEKITNEVISTANEVGRMIQKVTPKSWFDPVSVDLKEKHDSLVGDLKKRLEEEKKDIADFKQEELPEEIEKFAEFLKDASYNREGDWSFFTKTLKKEPLTYEQSYALLQTYLKDWENEDLNHYLNYSEVGAKEKAKTTTGNLQSAYKKQIEAAKKKELLDEKKDFFNFDLAADTKSITTPYYKKPSKPGKRLNFDYAGFTGDGFEFVPRDSSPKKSDWSALDYAFAAYGVDIKNEYQQPKDLIDYRAKGWVRELDKTDTFRWINKYIIGYLTIAKKWLNEQVGKVVQTLKGLQAFIGEAVQSEFKVLGDLAAVAHLIRFVRLIMKFSEKRLSCENVRQNKKMAESLIEQNNKNISVEAASGQLNYNNKLLAEEDYIKIKHKATGKINIIDLTECSDLNSMIKVNKDSLDSIYEGILNGLHT